MGQAFRRASGRIRSPGIDTKASPSSSSQLKKTVEREPEPVIPVEKLAGDNLVRGSEDDPRRVNSDNVLEEKDPQYDAMLSQMVGTIRSKPRGKFESGEASVAEKYTRSLPKLRNTTPETGRYEGRPAPPGTLNVAQIKHIVRLHQGNAEDHSGPMDIRQIADKFRVDIVQVERILQFVSLPPEDMDRIKKDQQ